MGKVHLYTGHGGGKSTSALGVALRALGHNYKVIVIQFMKGRKEVGEYKMMKKLGPKYEIHQFGTQHFVSLKKPTEEDRKRAAEALEFSKKALRRKPFLLILDEINVACAAGLVDTRDVLKLLKRIPKRTSVYLTGRYAPRELIKRADFATQVMDLHRPRIGSYEGKGIEW